jgi:hypothetical protein
MNSKHKKNNNNHIKGSNNGNGDFRRSVAETGDSSLPIIDWYYEPNAVFCAKLTERFSIVVGKRYLHNNYIFKNREEYEYDEIEVDNNRLEKGNDPYQLYRDEVKSKISKRNEKILSYNENKVAVYNIIWDQCTNTMKQTIKQAENFSKFEDKDPLALWIVIYTLLMTGSTKEIKKDDRVVKAFNDFGSSLQRNLDIADFYSRFNSQIALMETLKMPILSDSQLARSFISKLDPNRYTELTNTLTNDELMGKDVYPKTLVDAYRIASNYVKPITIVTTDKHGGEHIKMGTAFLSDSRRKQTKNSNKNNNKKHRHKNDEKVSGDDSKDESKDTDWTKTATCFKCGEIGHIAKRCRNKKIEMVHMTCNVAFLTGTKKLNKFFVHNDNQASVSVFKEKSLLKNIRKTDDPVMIVGIGGHIECDTVGDYDWFGEVYYSPNALANILCEYDIKSRFPYGHLQDDNDPSNSKYYVDVSESRRIFFKCKNKLHVYDASHPNEYEEKMDQNIMIHTVAGNEMQYTKRQVADAQGATTMIKRLAYPSIGELEKMISSGGILNSPVTLSDVKRAELIYGKDLAILKGKTTQQKSAISDIEIIPKFMNADLVLCTDLMFINEIGFLVSVSEDLGLLMVNYIPNRQEETVKNCLDLMINAYKAENFNIRFIKSDGEGAFKAMTSYLNGKGIGMNPTGKNQHVPVVERKIRQIKERVRSHISVIPYMLTVQLLIFLVYFCVQAINMFPQRTREHMISPRELFCGRKLDYSRDCRIEFGEYVQIHEDDMIKNSMKPRTADAIAVKMKGNVQGTAEFLSLSTWRIVSRDRWTSLPMPQTVIDKINTKALSEKRRGGIDGDYQFSQNGILISDNLGKDNSDDVRIERPNVNVRAIPDIPHYYDHDVVNTPIEQDQSVVTRSVLADRLVVQRPTRQSHMISSDSGIIIDNILDDDEIQEIHEDILQRRDQSVQPEDQDQVEIYEEMPNHRGVDYLNIDDVYENVEEAVFEEPVQASEDTVVEELNQVNPRYNLRPKRSAPGRWAERDGYAFIHTESLKTTVRKLGSPAMQSALKELKQMVDKKVWTAVKYSDLSLDQRAAVIRSKMFVKEKKDGTIKARLVAGGHMQDKSIYEDLSSPTVATHNVFMIAAIAASENRKVTTVDIEGAYLNADMGEQEVFMKLDPYLSRLLKEVDSDHYKFITDSGESYVKLKKALYGCVESARLFYLHVKKSLNDFGYECNPYDECVFNKTQNGKQCTIAVHVDDLMITCESQNMIDDLLSELERVYKKIKINTGIEHTYLGMNFVFEKKGVKLSMEKFIDEILSDYEVDGGAPTPAANYLFTVSESSKKLSAFDSERFHTITAKLLYLGKRARPDLMTVVSFLTSRVREPTEEDNRKLERTLKYLNESKSLVMRLSSKKGMNGQIIVEGSVDASFAVHPDFKSHTGGGTTIGEGFFDVVSSKQKLNSKSSTEAELIGVSDYLTRLIRVRNWLIAQGYEVGPAILYQDNKSTITLAEKGKSNSQRTRHVNIRYFFIKDRIDAKEIELKYMPTDDMVADILTKPLQGKKFIELRKRLLNLEDEE